MLSRDHFMLFIPYLFNTSFLVFILKIFTIDV